MRRTISTIAIVAQTFAGLAQAADQTLTINLSAASMQTLTGVNMGPTPSGNAGNADLTNAYQAIGVTTIRTHDYYGPMDMVTLYPDQNADPTLSASYNFTESDKTFLAILNGGFTPYLRLGDSYTTGMGFPKLSQRRPINQDNWIKAAIEVIRHYNDASRWGTSKLRYVEIWNEPDNGTFWDGTLTEFNTFYAKAYKAIKAAYPNLKVGGPGYTPNASLTTKGQTETRSFLDYIKSQSVSPDFFSWHMYTNSPADYTTAAKFFRSELDGHGMTATESHVSEWNTETRNLSKTEQLDVRTGARGAAIMTAAWIAQQEQGIAQSLVYRGPDPDINAPEFYGIFYADARKKRVASAFSLWSDVVKRENRLSVTNPAASTTALYALAAQAANGEVGLLVANPNNQAYSYQVALSNGGTFSTGTLKEINSGDEAINTSTANSPTVDIPAYGVQLLSFLPGGYCSSTLTSDLRLSIPYVQYSGSLYAATAQNDGSRKDGVYLVSSSVSSAANPPCRPATLLSNLRLQIPSGVYDTPTGRQTVWGELDYVGMQGSAFLFKATRYGVQ